MPAPTRAEIEAAITKPSYLVEYWSGAAWVALAATDVLDVDGLNDIGTGSSGLDFGAAAQPSVTLKLERNATTSALAWSGLKVRISFGFAASTLLVRLTGIVDGRQRALDTNAIVLAVVGFNNSISKTPVYSPLFYRRLAFTMTTLTSVEDPTSGVYAAGLGNYIFWQAGGRPLEQAATYPTALFYYTCQPALMGSEWSWIAGEDGWAELNRLCKACGGQVFQQPDGTMTYVNPIMPSASGYAIDSADYLNASEDVNRDQYIATARCAFSARRLQPTQVVYEDTTPRLVEASSSIDITLTMDRPVYSYVTSAIGGTGLPSDDWVAGTVLYVDPLTYPDVIVTYSSRAAGRVVVHVSNTLSQPIWLSRLCLRGRPIAVVEQGIATAGSGVPELEVGDGAIGVQSRAHAERLCKLYTDVYSTIRPPRELSSMGYDPDRLLGEVIQATISEWSISAVNHRIVRIAPKGGATMDMTIVPVDGIPLAGDLFLVGTSYIDADTRQMGW